MHKITRSGDCSPQRYKLFLQQLKPLHMKSAKTLQTAGIAGIAALFIGVSLILFSFFQQLIDFVLHVQVSGIHH